MRVWLRNGYTQAYAQIMQHTHTHKAVTGRVEAKKLLSLRRQSNYRQVLVLSTLDKFQFSLKKKKKKTLTKNLAVFHIKYDPKLARFLKTPLLFENQHFQASIRETCVTHSTAKEAPFHTSFCLHMCTTMYQSGPPGVLILGVQFWHLSLNLQKLMMNSY